MGVAPIEVGLGLRHVSVLPFVYREEVVLVVGECLLQRVVFVEEGGGILKYLSLLAADSLRFGHLKVLDIGVELLLVEELPKLPELLIEEHASFGGVGVLEEVLVVAIVCFEVLDEDNAVDG